jgi:hypothetical protein
VKTTGNELFGSEKKDVENSISTSAELESPGIPVRDLPRHRGRTRYSIRENFFFPNLSPSRRPYPPRLRYGRRPPCPDRRGRGPGEKKKIIFNPDSAAVTDAYDECRDRP